MKLKLISFSTCPFVHRSVITLNQKKAVYEIEYIDLKNKPEWFLKLSPLGKVPLLLVNDQDVVFESNVINHYLDEVIPPVTLSQDPLSRAKEKAWIEYATPLLTDFFALIRTKDEHDVEEKYEKFFKNLEKLEPVIEEYGFFKGKDFSIIDSSYAPIFFRMNLFDKIIRHPRLQEMPKIKVWINTLLSLESVQNSVSKTFYDDFYKSIQSSGSIFASGSKMHS